MKRMALGVAALALMLIGSEKASAQVILGGGYYGGYYPGGLSVGYGTRIGNSGFLQVGYAAPTYGWGYSYPAYGWGAPAYGWGYSYPAYRGGYYGSYYSNPRWGYGGRRWGRW